ncbi:chemotaxis protein CheW [Bacillaceae bacterium]
METKKTTSEIKVIVFRLKDEEYGVEVNQVKSIERLDHITRVPKAPSFVKGVMNLRGVIIPLIDLRSRFQLEAADHTDQTRVIIVSVGEVEVGLIVDAAYDVIDIPTDMVEPPPQVVGGVDAAYLQGIAKLKDRLLILLNLEKVLYDEEIKELENIEG